MSGFVGFDLCYHKLIQPLLDQAAKENFQTACFLLDSDNDLIFSSEDRAFREAVGRALCVIAQESDQVIRCVCGIGVRIK